MPWPDRIADESGEVVAVLVTLLPRQYLLDGGVREFMGDAPAWCRPCQAFVCAEKLPDVERLEKRLRDDLEFIESTEWRQEMSTDRAEERQRWIENDARETRIKLLWLRKRVSEPRCLSCGSTALAWFDKNETMLHPVDGRRIHLGSYGAHWSTKHHKLTYSSEGLLLSSAPHKVSLDEGTVRELEEEFRVAEREREKRERPNFAIRCLAVFGVTISLGRK